MGKKIGISLLNLRPGKVGGIETYIRKVVEWASRVADGDEVVFFVHRDNRDVVPDSEKTVVVDCSQRAIDFFRALEAFTPWRARSIERLIEASGIDAMFYTQQTIFPIGCRVPSLLFIADVQYLFYPRYFSRADLAFRRRIYLKSMKVAAKITTVSQFTADHIIDFCGVKPEKITVIHHGFDFAAPPTERSSKVPDDSYLYYPAASYPHKGHAVLFRSFAELVRRGDVKQRLLLSGERNTHWTKLEKILREEGMEDRIVHLGYVSFSDVLSLYQHADAIVFPSEFEGFGLPVLEAVQFRKKIVCSQLPTFAELGVPPEWQVDFSEPDQLGDALSRPGPTELSRLPISWHEAIRLTIDLVRDMAEDSCIKNGTSAERKE